MLQKVFPDSIIESKNGFYREKKYSPAQFSIPSDKSYSIIVELSGFTAKINLSNVMNRPSKASHSLFCTLDFITPDTILYYKSLDESVKETDLPSMAILRLFSKELGDSIKELPIKWFSTFSPFICIFSMMEVYIATSSPFLIYCIQTSD